MIRPHVGNKKSPCGDLRFPTWKSAKGGDRTNPPVKICKGAGEGRVAQSDRNDQSYRSYRSMIRAIRAIRAGQSDRSHQSDQSHQSGAERSERSERYDRLRSDES